MKTNLNDEQIRKKSLEMAHEMFNVLIACWSGVWSATIIALGNIGATVMKINLNVIIACWSGVWAATIIILGNMIQHAMRFQGLIVSVFKLCFHIFAVWALGCIAIILIHWALSELFDWIDRSRRGNGIHSTHPGLS